ncbi:hypothetical protein BCR37DRAFT_411588 [Protomyces lactucae-debilis]|uniref:RWD domain-containing protein n=1 Tax=Protomyces lactucae-debilis TaxID=2754530 RepID=A0A1Y2FVI7_PROLT|nr:uncharacterized protein BCR37DRAFT_411588 [Protomyces lactucae-debilis]ORY87998.1 hypothetical protein BCR37DRAFT_411588 [Protomyces lactucae-debilis]
MPALAELALLVDTYSDPTQADGLITWANAEGESLLKSYRDNPDGNNASLSHDLCFTLKATEQVTLDVTLPQGYPEKRPLIRFVGMTSREQHEELNAISKTTAEMSQADDLPLFAIYQAVLEHIGSWQEPFSGSAEKLQADATSIHIPSFRRRILFWSHHLIADSKRKDLQTMSSSSLVIIAKIGWPGYIAAEGDADLVQDFIKEVKTWRWQAITLRFDIMEESSKPALLNMLKTYTEVGSLAELSQLLADEPGWFEAGRH